MSEPSANANAAGEAQTQTRKADHLRVCLESDVQFRQTTTGLERYRFVHCCLPELDGAEVDCSTSFLGKFLQAPLLISSMTGGTETAKRINERLAEVAQFYQIAMGVGSMRVALEKPEVVDTFAMRRIAPDALLFANLGAVQLNYQYGVDEYQRAVDLLQADALILHLNPLQECVQTNGDVNFQGLLDKIADLCSKVSVPVMAKEVGNGISAAMAQKLQAAGVAAIDVAGAGGTSWAKVEGQRSSNVKSRRLGQTFADWGLPTAECLENIHQLDLPVSLIASGGIQNGLEVAKAIALGADLVGLARPFLQAAAESSEAVYTLADILMAEMKTALFCTGNANFQQLRQSQCWEKIQ